MEGVTKCHKIPNKVLTYNRDRTLNIMHYATYDVIRKKEEDTMEGVTKYHKI
jgi:hypothetical protein